MVFIVGNCFSHTTLHATVPELNKNFCQVNNIYIYIEKFQAGKEDVFKFVEFFCTRLEGFSFCLRD